MYLVFNLSRNVMGLEKKIIFKNSEGSTNILCYKFNTMCRGTLKL